VPTGQTASAKGHFFLWGLAGHADIYAYAECPTGVSKIESKFSFLDVVMNTVTIALYSPRSYDLECGMGGVR
jgi:Bor protein